MRRPRCYICRGVGTLRVSGPDPAIQVCTSCFSAVPRVLELERREASTIGAIRAIEPTTPELRRIVDSSYGDQDVYYRDALSEAKRLMALFADDCEAHRANTHAIITTVAHGKSVSACHMPGCRICAVSHLAREFVERRGLST